MDAEPRDEDRTDPFTEAGLRRAVVFVVLFMTAIVAGIGWQIWNHTQHPPRDLEWGEWEVIP